MSSFSSQQRAFISTLAGRTGLNSGVVAAWLAAEEPVGATSGYHGTQDWLNVGITDSGPMGAGNAVWRDPTQAAIATANWIKGTWSDPGFGHASSGIQRILRTVGQSPQAQLAAIRGSGWASGGYPALGQLYATYASQAPGASSTSLPALPKTSGPSSAGAAPVGMPTTTTQFDQAGYQKAVNASIAGNFLQSNAKSPFDLPGPKTGVSASAGLSPLFSAGLTTQAPNRADYTSTVFQQAQGALQKLAGGTALNQHPAAFAGSVKGSGYTNPLPGGHYTRTDMGVDAGMTNGAAIKAIGNMKYVGTSANWYAGQPYLLFQLLDGPQAGKYVYYAEAIRPGSFRPGQVIAKGATIGTFNGGGTGLELGWGSPVPGRTLAQAQGNTGSSTHELSPAGISFRNFLNGIGANAGANY